MLRVLVIIFSLNHIACAGLFTGEREIIIVAAGNWHGSARPLAWLCRTCLAAILV